MNNKVYRVLLLAFMMGSCIKGSILHDAVSQGAVEMAQEIVEMNGCDKTDSLFFLQELTETYVWTNIEVNLKFVEFVYKCNYFQKNLSQDEFYDDNNFFNISSWYEGELKDILPLIKIFIKKLSEDSLDHDSALKLLEAASAIGDEKTMVFILDGKEQWRGNSDLGESLINTILLGRLEAVRLLLQHGARRGSPCTEELLLAMHLGYEEITPLLIQYGADIEDAKAWLNRFPVDLKFEWQDIVSWWNTQYERAMHPSIIDFGLKNNA